MTATTSRIPGAGWARIRRRVEPVFWYVLLSLVAVVTVFPFVWMLLTSLKGPTDEIFSVPPQLLPGHPTLANYGAVPWSRGLRPALEDAHQHDREGQREEQEGDRDRRGIAGV